MKSVDIIAKDSRIHANKFFLLRIDTNRRYICILCACDILRILSLSRVAKPHLCEPGTILEVDVFSRSPEFRESNPVIFWERERDVRSQA